MDLDDGAVHRHRLQLEADDLLPLQLFEHPVEHPVLFRRLFDAGSPRLFDVTGARISQIVRSFPDR